MGLSIHHVNKSFGEPPHRVLKDINIDIDSGEFVAISGKSGSGKTTLLYILSTLDDPTSGEVKIDGVNPYTMSTKDIHEFRNAHIGFIFQFHYLLPELSAIENILLPARKHDLHRQKYSRAEELMNQFGLTNKNDRLPSQLSGGEQQRVAIARSLIMEPKYLFADEPTGNLDSANGLVVMDLLKKINREQQTTVVLVTHETDYAEMTSRIINLVDGEVVP
ncbi:MAG: ABC transporter ATP-binding protein [Bdellovibrionales bacterium]|nr:ABC transporter ATP-binding protein [Bdellovibrionales bacterium]